MAEIRTLRNTEPYNLLKEAEHNWVLSGQAQGIVIGVTDEDGAINWAYSCMSKRDILWIARRIEHELMANED